MTEQEKKTQKQCKEVFLELQKMPLKTVQDRVEFMKVLNTFNPLQYSINNVPQKEYYNIISKRLIDFAETLK